MKNIRHGDLALIGIKKLPEGLKETKSKVILEGKSNTHKFDNGKLYLRKDGNFVIGYFEAKNTTLFHKDHGTKIEGSSIRKTKIPNGFYELRVQNEDTNEGMKQVID